MILKEKNDWQTLYTMRFNFNILALVLYALKISYGRDCDVSKNAGQIRQCGFSDTTPEECVGSLKCCFNDELFPKCYDQDDCFSNPCQNEGSCVDYVDRYECLCFPGSTGDVCEIDINECLGEPCQNGAKCNNFIFNKYSCECLDGFTGQHCETDIEECASVPCEHDAECVDLVNDYQCICPVGYTSKNCEIDEHECQSNPCKNGICIDGIGNYSCKCSEGFDGYNCDVNINECASNPCVHGTCNDDIGFYSCQCEYGYIGWNCDRDVDECESSPCQNNATCENKLHGFTCYCLDGFIGKLCDINVMECESQPCENSGSCTDLINGYTCTCMAEFTGRNCESQIIDGQWGGWMAWTVCSAQCQMGVRTRIRHCNHPPPMHGGRYCEGEAANSTTCVRDTCTDVDGKWGMWSSWGYCSATCDYGVKHRHRVCDSPPPKGRGRYCGGTNTSDIVCTDRSCGVPIDGGWNDWGAWSKCSTTCDVGTSSRTRQCNRPNPVYGGAPCVGANTNYQPCIQMLCPKYDDCEGWSEWTSCSSSCGDGLRSRSHICHLNQEDTDEEIFEEDSKEQYEIEHCEDQPCPVTECYHCSSNFNGKAESLTCKGPTKQCTSDEPYCIYVFSNQSDLSNGVTKRCASGSECSVEMEKACKDVWIDAIDGITTDDIKRKRYFLEPHMDTLLEIWKKIKKPCHVCCRASRCNRGLLPATNHIYTGTATHCYNFVYFNHLVTISTLVLIFL